MALGPALGSDAKEIEYLSKNSSLLSMSFNQSVALTAVMVGGTLH
jgi:hypothetical protein